ncbi:methylthioribulose-1-phosphate dehydratase [Acidithiobacillus sp. GGI-221]|nr:methylthioribulose-1-phosphate dehydratase [Acidithiobacillus sp. GGI-221]
MIRAPISLRRPAIFMRGLDAGHRWQPVGTQRYRYLLDHRQRRPKDRLAAGDFVLVDRQGQVVQAPPGRQPSAEAAIHETIYRHVPDARVIFHVHSIEANLCGHFARQGRLRLPPLEMLKGLGVPDAEPQVDLPVFANHLNVARIAEDMDREFTGALPRVPGALIHLHGVTAWGPDFLAARHHLELLEYCFRYLVQAKILAIGV